MMSFNKILKEKRQIFGYPHKIPKRTQEFFSIKGLLIFLDLPFNSKIYQISPYWKKAFKAFWVKYFMDPMVSSVLFSRKFLKFSKIVLQEMKKKQLKTVNRQD